MIEQAIRIQTHEVSVFCLTYNHVEFIEDAIKGVLDQKTTFRYNLFIYDDASTDGTSEIVRAYAKAYPNIINAYISPINLYRSPERKDILRRLYDQYLDGKYIAWCEGDDYWIDDRKLQKQYEIMEQFVECSMVTHSFYIKNYQDDSLCVKEFRKSSDFLTPEEIIMQPNGNLGTASLFMKRKVFLREKDFPDCDVEDVPIQLNALTMGRIFYLAEPMSVYRYYHNGSWCQRMADSSRERIDHLVSFVLFLKKYNIFSGRKFEEYIWRKIVQYIYEVIELVQQYELSIEEFDIPNEIQCCMRSVFDWFGGKIQKESVDLKDVEKAKKIYIMGHGKYSSYVYNSLKQLGIDICGFVVSFREYDEKNVYTLDEIDDGSVIFVGISQLKEDEIRSSLEKRGLKNIHTPLWFDRKGLLGE